MRQEDFAGNLNGVVAENVVHGFSAVRDIPEVICGLVEKGTRCSVDPSDNDLTARTPRDDDNGLVVGGFTPDGEEFSGDCRTPRTGRGNRARGRGTCYITAFGTSAKPRSLFDAEIRCYKAKYPQYWTPPHLRSRPLSPAPLPPQHILTGEMINANFKVNF